MTDSRQDLPSWLVVRRARGTSVDALAARVQEDRRRLRERLEAVQRQAVALTPSHQLRTSPIAWALGAATIGLLLGVITAPRR